MSKLNITTQVSRLLEYEVIKESIVEFDEIPKTSISSEQLATIHSLAQDAGIEIKTPKSNYLKQVYNGQPAAIDVLIFEIPLLAASADEVMSPWWEFDVIVDELFQLVILSSESKTDTERVIFELNPIQGKETEFKVHCSNFAGTKRGIRVFFTKNEKHLALEGKVLYFADGVTVTGEGQVVSKQHFQNSDFSLMLELFPLKNEE